MVTSIWCILYTNKVIRGNDMLLTRISWCCLFSYFISELRRDGLWGMGCEPAIHLSAPPDEAVSIIFIFAYKTKLSTFGKVAVGELYYWLASSFSRASCRCFSYNLSLGSLTYLTYAYGMLTRQNAWEVGIDPMSTRTTYSNCMRSGRNHPGSWCNNAPMGWNWHLASWHTKVWPEAATQESCNKQAQQKLAKQQAQWCGGCWQGVRSKQGGNQAEDYGSTQASQAGWSHTQQDSQIPCWPHGERVNPQGHQYQQQYKGEIGNIQWWTDKKTRWLSDSVKFVIHLSKEVVVSCKHSAQDMCVENKVRKYHSMCKMAVSICCHWDTMEDILLSIKMFY